ncbi:MAG: hypothetical protein Q7U66_12805 [Methylobacter sp.]|nr:hypothetical protein [Methylobacter sp.]
MTAPIFSLDFIFPAFVLVMSSLSVEDNSSLRLGKSNQHIATGVQALLVLAGEACTPVVSSFHT